MSTQPAPGFLTRVFAALGGEVSAETLDAYRRAGGPVYDLLLEAEERRDALIASGAGAWSADPATRAFLLCVWNAFALQTLGDEFVEADYRANPRTAGFVPKVTREQALRFYADVEQWLGRARRAEADPGYRLDVRVPAEAPAWVDVEPCPHEHLHAMLSAVRKLREHAELAVADVERSAGEGHAEGVAALRRALAAVTSGADYAEALHEGRPSQELHERIERSVKAAIEGAFRVGQLSAMPELLDSPEAIAAVDMASASRRLPGPGEPGFDPWCLTDAHTRDAWRGDPKARRAVETLWSLDPDPSRTLAIQSEIDAALAAGYVDYATDRDGRRLGNFYCCPWSAVYVAKQPVTIGGTRLRTMQQFAFDVSAEEIGAGGSFKRELLVASFSPTDRVDYCDPAAGGHHDD